jgi:RNA polymerase sigma factor (sigma-70 family)
MTESAHIFQRYVQGDQHAADELFYRYVERLTRLARSRLSAALGQRIDAEDVVMSAYRSFFIGARDGEFAIQHSGELWSLLVRITLNKLYRSAAYNTAQRRSIGREVALPDELANAQPSVSDAVALTDELEAVMRSLPENRRRILELRLQGELIESIAGELGINERTVRRALAEVREKLVTAAGLPGDWSQPVTRAKAQSVPSNRPVSATLRYADFLLEQQVGIGGMGRVYRAIRKSDGAIFAIKYLRKSVLKRPGAVERFAEEAATVATLEHPNIVGVHGFGSTNAGGFFIAMDYVSGTDLATIAADKRPTAAQIAGWLLPICDALQHAHSRGVIHCDLKPANILVRDDGVPLLTDFGLAQRDGERGRLVLSGTAPFMAPEQIDESPGAITERTDVYGLGAVVFNLATGRPPFVGARAVDVMADVVSRKKPPRPSDVSKDAAVFDQLCVGCLCRSENRFGLHELIESLQRLS